MTCRQIKLRRVAGDRKWEPAPPPLREEGDERRGTRGGEREEGDEKQKILISPITPIAPHSRTQKIYRLRSMPLIIGGGVAVAQV